MADEHKSSGGFEPVIIIVCMLVFLVALAWARGGLSNINSEGFFIAPPNIAPNGTYLPPPDPSQPARVQPST